MFGGRQGDLHPNLNSSNLAPPVLKQLDQFRGELAQFGGYRAVIRSKRQGLLFQLQYMAGARQSGGGNQFVMTLQCLQLSGLAG